MAAEPRGSGKPYAQSGPFSMVLRSKPHRLAARYVLLIRCVCWSPKRCRPAARKPWS